MELKSNISVTSMLFTFGTSLAFLLLLLILMNNSHNATIFNARNSMAKLAPFGQFDHGPLSTMINFSDFKSESEFEPGVKPLHFINNPPTNMTKGQEPKCGHDVSNSTVDLLANGVNLFESEPKHESVEHELKPSHSITNPPTNLMNGRDLKYEHDASNSTTNPLASMIKGSTVLMHEHDPEPELEHESSGSKSMTIEHPQNLSTNSIETPTNKTSKKCNIFDGRWVFKEEETPTYNKTVCPFLEEKMSCHMNGRPDYEYEKWIWKAKECDIPLFNGRDMLERLRNKRVIIVGDSLNRNQWESLACLLYSSIHPSRAIVDAEGPTYKLLKAKDYNFKLEFYWSPFMITFDEKHKSGKKVLILDKLPSTSKKWKGADVMVFNSGHWWTHHGKFKAWDMFEYEGKLLEEVPIQLAYERSMRTWAKWVESNVNPNETKVFFRSISAIHMGNQWCYNSTQPMVDDSYKSHFPISLVETIEGLIEEMNKKMQFVKYLNITKLSEYRIDAHPSVYRSWRWKIYTQKYKRLIPSYADCSHWCLPGVPDTWNRLLYFSLFFDTQERTSVF